MTDEQLNNKIYDFQSGDMQAFGDIYEAFFDKIYRFVFFRVQHKETTEDLVSDIFYKVSRGLKTYDANKSKFSTWIYTIAKNVVFDHWKTNREHEGLDAVDLFAFVRPADIDASWQLEKVRAYVNGLPENIKNIMIMRVWDGLSHAEIAEILHQSEASVKMSYSRTIHKIRQRFGARYAVIFLIFFALS